MLGPYFTKKTRSWDIAGTTYTMPWITYLQGNTRWQKLKIGSRASANRSIGALSPELIIRSICQAICFLEK